MKSRDYYFVTLVSIINLVAAGTYGLLVARIFSVEDYGLIASINMLTAFIGYLTFGLIDGYGKIVSDNRTRNKLISKTFFVILVFILILYLCVAFFLGSLVALDIIDGILFISLIISFLTMLRNLSIFQFNINLQFKAILLNTLALWLSIFILWWLLHNKINRFENFTVFILGLLLSSALGFYQSKIVIRKKIYTSILRKSFIKGFPIALSSFNSTTLFFVERLFITFVLSLYDFGLYAFIIGLASMVGSPALSISSAILTRIRHLRAENNHILIKSYYLRSIFFFVISGTILLYTCNAFVPTMIEIYFSQYSEGISLVPWLFLSGLCSVLVNHQHNVIHAFDRSYLVVFLNIISLIISIIVNSLVLFFMPDLMSFAQASTCVNLSSLLIASIVIFKVVNDRLIYWPVITLNVVPLLIIITYLV